MEKLLETLGLRPNFIKDTGELCVRCRSKVYEVSGKKSCGKCSLEAYNRVAEQKRVSRCRESQEALEKYNREQMEKRR